MRLPRGMQISVAIPSASMYPLVLVRTEVHITGLGLSLRICTYFQEFMTMKRIAVLCLLLSLCACTTNARLYNLDTGEMTPLVAHRERGSHGTIEGRFKSGESVKGEYQVVTQGTVGWGSVYTSVSSGTSTASGSGTATSIGIGKREGAIMMVGDQGLVLQCEFIMGLEAHGTGYCKDNHNGKYRLLF